MTLWSEIVNTPLEKVKPAYFGIEYDKGSFLPPKGIYVATFKYKSGDADVALDLDVLDIIIAQTKVNRGSRIALEVDFAEENVNWKKIMKLATYGEFSVAIIPPQLDCSDEDYEKYKDQVSKLAKEYFPLKSFSGIALPLTAIIRYMLKCSMSDKAPLDNLIDGEMMVDVEMFEHIYGQMSLNEANNKKLLADIKPVIYECFGSKEDFETFAVDFKQNVLHQQQKEMAFQEGQRKLNQAMENARREEANLNQIANQ